MLPCRVTVPTGGVAGVLLVPAPLTALFLAHREDSPASFPDRQSLLPTALFHPTPVHPKAPPGPEVRIYDASTGKLIRTAASGPGPPGALPHAGLSSFRYLHPLVGRYPWAAAGREEQAACGAGWGQAFCTVSRLSRVQGWAGGGMVLPGRVRGLSLPRASKGAGGSPGPPALPCQLHPQDTGWACREQLPPCADTRALETVGCVSVLMLGSRCGQTDALSG